MSARTRIAAIAFSCLVTALPSLAADRAATPPPATPAKAPATTTAPAKPSSAKSAKPAVAKTAGAKPATRKTAAAKSSAPAGKRTLGDVHIEGEVPVPQVLFVTARDQRRVLDFGHRRYLRTSREVAASTALPARLAAPPPAVKPAATPTPAPVPAPAPRSPETP